MLSTDRDGRATTAPEGAGSAGGRLECNAQLGTEHPAAVRGATCHRPPPSAGGTLAATPRFPRIGYLDGRFPGRSRIRSGANGGVGAQSGIQSAPIGGFAAVPRTLDTWVGGFRAGEVSDPGERRCRGQVQESGPGRTAESGPGQVSERCRRSGSVSSGAGTRRARGKARRRSASSRQRSTGCRWAPRPPSRWPRSGRTAPSRATTRSRSRAGPRSRHPTQVRTGVLRPGSRRRQQPRETQQRRRTRAPQQPQQPRRTHRRLRRRGRRPGGCRCASR